MNELVGLIPAAGHASRLPNLSGSKEIIPVRALNPSASRENVRPVCCHLLDAFSHAGVARCVLVTRTAKSDIPACLLAESLGDIAISYIFVNETLGVPWTIDAAFPFLSDSSIAFGFPDILASEGDLYNRLKIRLDIGGHDIVLGVFPTDAGSTVDVVTVAKTGTVLEVLPKPPGVASALSWIAAVWRPTFTAFLHDKIAAISNPGQSGVELYIGDFISAAISELDVAAVVFPNGHFLDIGTQENLARVRSNQA